MEDVLHLIQLWVALPFSELVSWLDKQENKFEKLSALVGYLRLTSIMMGLLLGVGNKE